MMDTVTIVGNVATDPNLAQTGGGVAVTNFRLASTHRRFDQSAQAWVDSGTNWYSVAAYRQLGEHAKASLRSGDSVIVTGRLRIRNWESNGKSGTSVDIDADAIGHDLRWGTSAYLRSSRTTPASEAPAAARDTDADDRDDEESAPLALDAAWAETDASLPEEDATAPALS
ncbi:single-stranded DNA-binding protein [Microbacterium sp. NPDC090225]|uniref:single-stranded DNA-binding protein n=1 Tax=Microbacterium sp. NPDC090225 TaxID=3364207 RepID=UPI003826F18E